MLKMCKGTITTFLFDIDGTLIDNTRIILESLEAAYHTVLKEEMDKEIVRKQLGRRARDITSTLKIPSILQDAFIQESRSYREIKSRQGTFLIPGTRLLLKTLKLRKCKLGVVSAKRRKKIQEDLDYYQISHFFDVIIGAEDCSIHKPSPDPIIKACSRLRIEPTPKTVAYIGDTIFDIQAAKAANVCSVGMLYGAHGYDLFSSSPNLTTFRILDLLDLAPRLRDEDRIATIDTSDVNSHDPEIRKNLAWAIGFSKEPQYLSTLLKFTKDPVSKVRMYTLWALGEINNESIIPTIGEILLHDEKDDVRMYAAQALSRFESEDIVPYLEKGIQDSFLEVRRYSAIGLAKFDIARARTALKKAFKNTEEDTVLAAIEKGLRKIK